ncbi:hypothetical protein ACFL3C_00750 [Patescibacteria group bacterium]
MKLRNIGMIVAVMMLGGCAATVQKPKPAKINFKYENRVINETPRARWFIAIQLEMRQCKIEVLAKSRGPIPVKFECKWPDPHSTKGWIGHQDLKKIKAYRDKMRTVPAGQLSKWLQQDLWGRALDCVLPVQKSCPSMPEIRVRRLAIQATLTPKSIRR